MSVSVTNASTAAAGLEGQYAFVVEWFDTQAEMMRQYQLIYFQLDETIEMVTQERGREREREIR